MRQLLMLLAIPLTAAVLPARDFDHSHAAWTAVLERRVSLDGAISRVDYEAIRRHPAGLNTYLESLSGVSREAFESWDRDRRLAFLINAYNAFTVQLIVSSEPVDSIRDLGGWLSTPWKKDFFVLLGERRNLDDIEHGMIRRDYQEPRIHFAVNCASLSCPPLRREAYIAERLEQQLEDSTRLFLRDARRNRFDAGQGVLQLSSIFKWYASDFVAADGSIEAFVAPRITDDPAARARISSRDVRIRYLDYDWALNDR